MSKKLDDYTAILSNIEITKMKMPTESKERTTILLSLLYPYLEEKFRNDIAELREQEIAKA